MQQGATDETSIPTENERNGARMSMRRKFVNLLEYFNPFSTTLPHQQDEDEDTPARKSQRLEASSTEADAEDAADVDAFVDAQTYRYMADDTLTASPDDTAAVAPTHAVTVAAVFPSAGTSRPRPGNWSPEEDAKLTDAVTELGNAWVAVAAMIPGRSKEHCRYRWVAFLDPDFNTGKWTPEEDEKLTEAVTQLGKDWVQVAAMVPGRTNVLCRQRWLLALEPTIDGATARSKGKWTPEEDAKLTDAVQQLGKDWVAVAAMIPGRNNALCRQRWIQSLDPDISPGRWTVEESTKLTDAVNQFGNDWVRVAAMFPGRTNKQCRKRWGREFGPRHQHR
jgi:hypothetical protein